MNEDEVQARERLRKRRILNPNVPEERALILELEERVRLEFAHLIESARRSERITADDLARIIRPMD